MGAHRLHVTMSKRLQSEEEPSEISEHKFVHTPMVPRLDTRRFVAIRDIASLLEAKGVKGKSLISSSQSLVIKRKKGRRCCSFILIR